MKGSIYLIKVKNQRVVPALCLKELDNYFLFAQLRQANEEDIFNTGDRKEMEKRNKGKPDCEKIKILENYEIDTVFIGHPKGLKSKSVVMVRRLYKLDKHQLIKEIAKVSDETVIKCTSLIEQVNKIAKLHEELHILKRRLQFASINNEKYTHYEIRIDQILTEIGYPRIHKRNEKPYYNFREVPNQGHIKVYLGG